MLSPSICIQKRGWFSSPNKGTLSLSFKSNLSLMYICGACNALLPCLFGGFSFSQQLMIIEVYDRLSYLAEFMAKAKPNLQYDEFLEMSADLETHLILKRTPIQDLSFFLVTSKTRGVVSYYCLIIIFSLKVSEEKI